MLRGTLLALPAFQAKRRDLICSRFQLCHYCTVLFADSPACFPPLSARWDEQPHSTIIPPWPTRTLNVGKFMHFVFFNTSPDFKIVHRIPRIFFAARSWRALIGWSAFTSAEHSSHRRPPTLPRPARPFFRPHCQIPRLILRILCLLSFFYLPLPTSNSWFWTNRTVLNSYLDKRTRQVYSSEHAY